MNEYENVTLGMLYQKLQAIENEIKEINEDLHRVRPSFVEKLKKTEEGQIHKFKDVKEMETAIR